METFVNIFIFWLTSLFTPAQDLDARMNVSNGDTVKPRSTSGYSNAHTIKPPQGSHNQVDIIVIDDTQLRPPTGE